MTAIFRHLEQVCKVLGLKCKEIKKGCLWTGIIDGRLVRIPIHLHCEGRDIASGTFNKNVKDLGFSSAEGFWDYLRNL